MCPELLVSMGVGATTAAAIASAAPWVTAAVSAGTAVAGGIQSSNAQSRAAAAIRDQNAATTQAQNLAFTQRMDATRKQSDAQADTANREIAARTTSALATRAAQSAALERQNSTVNAENATAEQLRAEGDRRAQELLATTTAPGGMDKSQQGFQDQTAALLASTQAPGPTGPEATNPDGSGAETSTGDTQSAKATARRMGIAAANVRQYGADIARVASYGAPMVDTGQAIKANAYGIMPTENASRLLSGGAAVRLLPSQTAYRAATDYGAAEDATIQSRAQGENAGTALGFGNTTGRANLGQSDADTRAANIAKQQTSDADWTRQIGGLISGLGNLGAYGAGLYGPNVLPRPTVPGGNTFVDHSIT